jgi:chemotaxis protein methyltransferase CheR
MPEDVRSLHYKQISEETMFAINEAEFLRLINYMKSNYGINLTQKRTLIEGRLSNTVLEKGFSSFGDYLNFVFSDKTGVEIETLINKLTTNHTFFMREFKHFDYFRDTVLPFLSGRIRDKDLRIWSAGCSSGEEPYTLQMIMNDYFGNDSTSWDKQILATDISTRALEIAKAGTYPLEAISEISTFWRLNYFDKLDNERVRVKETIKKDVTFRKFNLMEELFPFKRKFHVIFCRNVMIYFEQKTKLALINKFYDCLDDGGYLFIGHSETIDRDETNFKYIMPAVYRR